MAEWERCAVHAAEDGMKISLTEIVMIKQKGSSLLYVVLCWNTKNDCSVTFFNQLFKQKYYIFGIWEISTTSDVKLYFLLIKLWKNTSYIIKFDRNSIKEKLEFNRKYMEIPLRNYILTETVFEDILKISIFWRSTKWPNTSQRAATAINNNIYTIWNYTHPPL